MAVSATPLTINNEMHCARRHACWHIKYPFLQSMSWHACRGSAPAVSVPYLWAAVVYIQKAEVVYIAELALTAEQGCQRSSCNCTASQRVRVLERVQVGRPGQAHALVVLRACALDSAHQRVRACTHNQTASTSNNDLRVKLTCCGFHLHDDILTKSQI